MSSRRLTEAAFRILYVINKAEPAEHHSYVNAALLLTVDALQVGVHRGRPRWSTVARDGRREGGVLGIVLLTWESVRCAGVALVNSSYEWCCSLHTAGARARTAL